MNAPGEMARAAIRQRHAEVVAIRRAIHRHPELGYEEHETANLVRRVLKEHGIQAEAGVLPTSVIGRLGQGSPCIALRADMDGLTLQEVNQVEYCSEVKGVMHACGHDAHVAMLLGAAMALVDMGFRPQGSVLLLFQPAEESPKSGAQPLIDSGLLTTNKVDEIYALHLWPSLPKGLLGFREGPLLASSDGLKIVVHGVGGHCGEPHNAVDAIAVAAHIVVALQSLVARQTDPLKPIVLHIGTVAGGSRRSIVASSVVMTGTVRALDEQARVRVLKQSRQLTTQIAEGFGGSVEFEVDPTQPVTVNNIGCARRLASVADQPIELPAPVLVAEDFGRYLRQVPGAMGLLGCGEEGLSRGLHTATFDFDEDVLAVGTEILVKLVLDFFSAEMQPARLVGTSR
jgi:amidohydrolase